MGLASLARLSLASLAALFLACARPHDVVNDCRHGDCEAAAARCDQGDAWVCNGIGSLYERGGTDKADYGIAAGYYMKGCVIEPFVCASGADLGMKLAYGKPGYPKDAKLAGELFEKACKGRWARGCVELGVMHQSGAGGRKKSARSAALLFQRACAFEHPMGYELEGEVAYDGSARSDGCQALGEMFFTGEGVRQNPPLAAELFYRAEMFQAAEDRRQARAERDEQLAMQVRIAERRQQEAVERAESHAGLDLALGIGGRLLLAPLVAGAIVGVPGAAVAVATTQSVQSGVQLAQTPATLQASARHGGGYATLSAASHGPCVGQCDLDANRCNLTCDAANPLRVTSVAASNLFFGCTTSCEVAAMDCRCACSAALCGN